MKRPGAVPFFSHLAACLLLPGLAAAAPVVIYLDFDGYDNTTYLAANRFTYKVSAPAASLTNAEREDIRRRIAEDFAPFDVIVVTGPEPAVVSTGFAHAVRVAIGGSSTDWGYFQTTCGLSPDPTGDNTVLVAARDCDGVAKRTTKAIAKSASHELAHTFALVNGESLSHYTLAGHHALAGQTPILGTYFADRRDVWAAHTLVDGRLQNDFAVLWRALGLIAPDHPNWPTLASSLATISSGTALGGSGIVELNLGVVQSLWEPDPSLTRHLPLVDYFEFEAGAGIGGEQLVRIRVDTINVSSNDHAANLDADLIVFFDDPSASPRLQRVVNLVRGDGPADLWAEASFRISSNAQRAGRYVVGVLGAGAYADIGQYTITVRGEDVRPIVASTHSRPPEPGGGQATDWFYGLLADINGVPAGTSSKALLQVFAQHGALDPRFATSASAIAFTDAALRKHEPMTVFGGLFDGAWQYFGNDVRAGMQQELRMALRRFALSDQLKR